MSEEEARANALDRVLAALEGYNKAGRSLPRSGAGQSGADRVVLPSLVAAKLAVCGTMRARGWSKLKLATPLGMSDNAVRRLLDLRHRSQMWVVDAEMAKINAELPIDLPGPAAGGGRRDGQRIESDPPDVRIDRHVLVRRPNSW